MIGWLSILVFCGIFVVWFAVVQYWEKRDGNIESKDGGD